MASTAASISPPRESTAEDEVSLVRLYVLRAMYLLLVVGLGAMIVPEILSHEPASRGVIPSLLGAVWLLAFLGLRYPLEMLPLLMFEFAWKSGLDARLRAAAMVGRPAAADLRRGFLQHRHRRDPAVRHSLGLCLAALRDLAGRALALRRFPMASTIFPDLPGPTQTRDTEVPLWRLYLLRAMFLVFAVGGFLAHLQWLIDPDPTRRGMLDSMLAGLWVLAFFGLRNPLQLLPIFLFEFVWKTIWLVRFGLPQWMAGRSDPQLSEDLILIGLGPIVFGLIIPWGYVWRHYIKEPAERWR